MAFRCVFILLCVSSLFGCAQKSLTLTQTGPGGVLPKQSAPASLSTVSSKTTYPSTANTSSATPSTVTSSTITPSNQSISVDLTEVADTQTGAAQRLTPTTVGLQLGAFIQAGSAAMQIGLMKQRFPLLFEGREPIIRTTDRSGAMLYRVVIGPFASNAVAQAFCDQIKASGGQCFPTQYDRIDQNTSSL